MTKRLSEHGYLRVEQVAEPGEFAVRGAVFDVFPTGSAGAGARRPVRRRDRDAADVRRANAAFGRQDRQDRDPAGARVSVRRGGDQVLSASAFASTFPSSRAAAPSTARSPTRSCRPASSTTCRCSSTATASLFDYLARRHAVHRRRRRARSARRVVAAHRRALRAAARATSSGRSCSRDAGVLRARRAARAHRDAADADVDAARIAGARQRRRHASARRPASRQPTTASIAGSAPSKASARCSRRRRRGIARCCSSYCAAAATSRTSIATWAEFLAGDAPLGITVARDPRRLPLRRAPPARHHGHRSRHGTAAAAAQRKRRARDPETIIRELTDLQVGAPVVHEDYGVGRYRGLTTLDVEGMPTEFLLLEYAGGDKLYVPC